jgi:hypothetical protein
MVVNQGISIGRILFEEIDKPTESKIVFENKKEGVIERESSWTGEIKGYDSFPSGKASGSGRSFIHNNVSHWEGVLNTEDRQELAFKGRDVNKNGKFVVLRTYFTESEVLGWMDGLVCILTGDFDISIGVFKSTGYEFNL